MSGFLDFLATAAEVLGSLVGGLATIETAKWMPRGAQSLKELAVGRLPRCMAERLCEEWQAHLDATPGPVSKTLVAVGFVFAALRFRVAARFGAATRTEIVMTRRAAGFMASVLQKRVARLTEQKDGIDFYDVVREVEAAFRGTPGEITVTRNIEPSGPVKKLWAAVEQLVQGIESLRRRG
jgi:hypothetical protein